MIVHSTDEAATPTQGPGTSQINQDVLKNLWIISYNDFFIGIYW